MLETETELQLELFPRTELKLKRKLCQELKYH